MTKNKIGLNKASVSFVLLATVFLATLSLPGRGYAIESGAAKDQLVLHAEQWEAARAGDRLLSVPVLKHLVNTWAAHPHQKIELRYPGGEDGELWVSDLEDWLVSLGVASKYMSAVPGSGDADVIRFEIIQTGD